MLAFRRPTLLRLFLVWAFVLSLIVYSWAGEKFAWLALHPLLPLILLAGVGLQEIWASRRSLPGKLALGATALALAYTVYASALVNAVHPADPREFLVSTQSSTDVADRAREIVALDKRRGGKLKVLVDSAEGATFPWAWYFRDLDVGYLDLSTAGEVPPETDVIVLTQNSNTRLQPTLTGYDGDEIRFRVWWVRDYGKALSPGTGGAGSARASRGTRPAGCRSGSTCGAPGLRRRAARAAGPRSPRRCGRRPCGPRRFHLAIPASP